jgi:hypothetical protein
MKPASAGFCVYGSWLSVWLACNCRLVQRSDLPRRGFRLIDFGMLASKALPNPFSFHLVGVCVCYLAAVFLYGVAG